MKTQITRLISNFLIWLFNTFILYITSFFYHYNGENEENNIHRFNYKRIDEYSCRIVISICMLLSLVNYNIYPTIATLFISIMYYYKIAYTNTLHAMLIHFPGALGFFAIYYNNDTNDTNVNNVTKW